MTTLVSEYMSAQPFTIGHDIKLSVAHEMMRRHGVRHLPVLDAGKLVGVVSQRDLYFLETFRDVRLDEVSVEEAMTAEPFVVGGDAPIEEVALEMVRRKIGAVIVEENGKVAGIFTALDGLRALADLERQRAA